MSRFLQILLPALLIAALLPNSAEAQIDLQIKRVRPDSVALVFEKNLQLYSDSIYAFMIRTNLDAVDQVYENISGELVEDGKIIQGIFQGDEFEFQAYTLNQEKQPLVLQKHLLLIKGTRFVVQVDDQPLRRHVPGSGSPASRIDIRLVSERYKVEELEVKDPVLFSWHHGEEKSQYLPLTDRNLQLAVESLPGLTEGTQGATSVLPLLILLPQVYTKDQKALLPENAQDRLYTLLLSK